MENRIGKILKDRREELGFTQAYMADKLKICRSQLCKMELGRSRITVIMLENLMKFLKLKPSDIFP